MRTARIVAIVALAFMAGCAGNKKPGQGAGDADAAGLGSGAISSSGLAGATQPGTQADLEVNVGDRVLFGYDSVVLDAPAQETLRRQAAWLNQYPHLIVTIEGHADERGTREYNLALGDRRAAAVKDYLGALGVDPSRLLTISYGEERPANPLSNDQALAENRRAVTRVNVSA